jgi:hypothetical protein
VSISENIDNKIDTDFQALAPHEFLLPEQLLPNESLKIILPHKGKFFIRLNISKKLDNLVTQNFSDVLIYKVQH